MPRHPHPASEPLRFSVAIPLVTNPWIWLDMGKVLVVPWAALSLLALWILRDEPWSEVWPAWRVVTLCVLGVAALLVFVSLVVFRNHVDARFTVDADGVQYESGRFAGRAALWTGLIVRSALLTGAGLQGEAHSSMFVAWKDVRKATAFPRARVITLSNGWRPVLRVYCGDDGTYARVLEVVDARGGRLTR
jgi:hypothetical protein